MNFAFFRIVQHIFIRGQNHTQILLLLEEDDLLDRSVLKTFISNQDFALFDINLLEVSICETGPKHPHGVKRYAINLTFLILLLNSGVNLQSLRGIGFIFVQLDFVLALVKKGHERS